MYEERIYQIALTLIDGIGCVQTKALIERFETASNVFKANPHQIETIGGIGTIRAQAIKHFNNFSKAEDELKFCDKHNIQPLFITDKGYPKRLLNFYDSPTILYYHSMMKTVKRCEKYH